VETCSRHMHVFVAMSKGRHDLRRSGPITWQQGGIRSMTLPSGGMGTRPVAPSGQLAGNCSGSPLSHYDPAASSADPFRKNTRSSVEPRGWAISPSTTYDIGRQATSTPHYAHKKRNTNKKTTRPSPTRRALRRKKKKKKTPGPYTPAYPSKTPKKHSTLEPSPKTLPYISN